ncbi:hypothetical protein [Taibaiella lutea]|uniref:hypothetical protein n=1 Tax=Taibaiella lutea TaxID=2608001 RepID=UPI0037422AB5
MKFTKDNIGNRFNDDIKSAFQSLMAGDLVLFENIFCSAPDKKERALESIEFTIIP